MKRLLIRSFIILFLLIQTGTLLFGQSITKTSASNVSIPDQGTAYKSLTVSGLPSGSTITSVGYTIKIQHSYWDDLAIALDDDYSGTSSGREVILRKNEGGSRSGLLTKTGSTNEFNGLGANRTFYFRVWDNGKDDVGYIDYVSVEVSYSTPNTAPSSPRFISAPSQANTGQNVTVSVRSGTDPDGDQVKFHLTSPGSNYPNASPYKSDWFSSSGGQRNVTVTWSTAGNKTIYITSFDENGKSSSTVSRQISISNPTPTATLTSPNSGTYKVGGQMTIRWSSTNQHHYGLYLYKGGTSADKQIATIHITSASSATSYVWTVPATVRDGSGNTYSLNGSDYKIKVAVWNASGTAVGDYSNSNLTIQPASVPNPTVTLTNPNSGTYNVGSQMTIRWSSTNQHHYGLYLYKGGTSADKQIATIHITSASSATSYVWTVPATVRDGSGNTYSLNGSDYKIKVAVWNASSTAVGDYSNSNLTIQPASVPNPTATLTSPNSGTYSVGSQMTIRWSSTNQHHYGLYLYKGGTSADKQIATIHITSASSATSYVWTVPATVRDGSGNTYSLNGSDYKIKVAVWNASSNAVGDYSNSNLAIQSASSPNPTVTLTSPNSGTYNVGSQMIIRWSSTNQHHYGLYLYKGGTSADKQIATIHITSASGATSYIWTVPATVRDGSGNTYSLNGSDYKIKVAVWNASSTAVGDYSNSNLAIQSASSPNPTVTLTSPNSGTYNVGSQMTIRWSSTNQHHYGLYLYKGGTSADKQIATIHITSASSATSYVWTVPATVRDGSGNTYSLNGSDHKIKVAVWNASSTAVGDYSNSNLTIQLDNTPVPVITKVYTHLDEAGNPTLEGFAGRETTLKIEGNNLPKQIVLKILQLGIEENINIDRGKGSFSFELKNVTGDKIDVILKTADSKLQILKTLLVKQSPKLQVEILGQAEKYINQNFKIAITEYITKGLRYPHKYNGFQRGLKYAYEYSIDGGVWVSSGISDLEYVNINQENTKYLQVAIPKISNNCRIRIKDYYNEDVVGISDSFPVIAKTLADIDVSLEWDASFSYNELAHPIGVTADGVSRLLIKVSNKKTDNPISNIALSLQNPTGQSDPKQDGLGALKISTVTPDQYSDEANAATLQTIRDARKKLRDYYYWYKSPEDFSTDQNHNYHNNSERKVNVNIIVNYEDGQVIRKTQQILIARPPLVFVHGLGSNADTWNNFFYNFSSNSSVRFIDDSKYKVVKAINIEPNGSFRQNAMLLLYPPKDKKTAFGNREINSLPDIVKQIRSKGFASVQIDYIAHSMGGCVLRTIEYYNNRLFYSHKPLKYGYSNYGKGWVKKAITLNTPHNGSELADILKLIVSILNTKTVFNPINLAVSLRYGSGSKTGEFPYSYILPDKISFFKNTVKISPAVKNLQVAEENGGIRFKKTNIPTHLIAGDFISNEISLQLDKKTKRLFDFYDKIYTIYLLTSNPALFLIPKEKLKLLKPLARVQRVLGFIELLYNYHVMPYLEKAKRTKFIVNSDLIVSVRSQLADQERSNSNVKVFDGITHAMINPVLESIDVGNHVNTLLHTPKNSDKFKPIPGYSGSISSRARVRRHAREIGEKRTMSDDLTATPTVDNSLIELIYPLPNAQISSPTGQVQVSFRLQKINQLSSYSIFYADQHLLFNDTTIQKTTLKTHTLNEFPIGADTITIFAFYEIDGKVVQSHKRINVRVLPEQDIEALIVTPELNYLEPNKNLALDLLARRGQNTYRVNIEEVNLSIDDQNIIQYDSSTRQFKALKVGTTFATFEFSGQKDTVWFNVDDALERALRWRRQIHKLTPGWNLISFYLNPDDPKTQQLLESIKDKIIAVKDDRDIYDPKVPEVFNTLKSIKAGKGYWIKLSEATDLYTQGDIIQTETLTIALKTGWNLIAFPKENPQNVAEALASISDKVIEIKNKTQSYDPTLANHLNTLSQLKPGEGYWIKVKADCILKF